jgi:toxin ParE1/3/4
MAYRLTYNAQRDFEDIGDFIASHSPRAAADLAMRFMDKWELLATQPYSGQAVEDIAPDLRRLVMGEYVAFYRVDDGDVAIVRIFHGRRDFASEDFSE